MFTLYFESLLSIPERQNLIKYHRKEHDGRARDRMKVVLWLDEGKNRFEIAKLLFIHEKTVLKHLADYQKANKLHTSNGGSQQKLNNKQISSLDDHLQKKCYTKSADIAHYIQQAYCVKYSLSGVTALLHKMNFVYKKSQGIPAKADPEEQDKFVKKYRKLESRLPPDEALIFTDSVHPTQATKLGYGWIRKGKSNFIKTTASRSRLNISGSIDIQTKEILIQKYDTINGENIINFFKYIESNNPSMKKIHVVCDGAGYYRNQVLLDWIDTSKIELHRLPPYSPNLNPIERLWKIMNEYARNNQHFEKPADFKNAIGLFFSDTVPKIKAEINQRINSNFQRLPERLYTR